ncbi:3-oxoacyl-[acyl-carrier-protein] reductase [bacterium]|nr:3-oxoacyl-[acyl-carrier-protein] reductase [bacterium]
MLLKEKIAIVTGGARGIGKAISELLAKEGARVVIADLDKKEAEKTAKEIGQAFALELDVTSSSSVNEMIGRVQEEFGRIDILVNNAGITKDTLLLRMKDEDFKAVLDVNLTGAFRCTKSAAKIMMKQRQGRIINISSIIGLIGNAGQANYAASKAGLIALTKTSAKELAPRGILVNAICPGFIRTAMTDALPDKVKEEMLSAIPLKKFGQSVDVAKAVLFLSSDLSSYITGQIIVVDGGLVMQ